MDTHSKRTRHNKSSKQSRKPRPVPLHPIISGEIPPQFSHPSGTLTARSSISGDPDRLNDIIDDMTSEGDDARVGQSPKLPTRSTSNLVEPNSPPTNDNRSSLYALPISLDYSRGRLPPPSTRSGRTKKLAYKEKGPNRSGSEKYFSPNRKKSVDDGTDSTNRRKSIGDVRRQHLTECMEYYRHCLESAQNSNIICMNDDPTNNDKRKQYSTSLW
jgi:hypothetical protein